MISGHTEEKIHLGLVDVMKQFEKMSPILTNLPAKSKFEALRFDNVRRERCNKSRQRLDHEHT